MLTGEDDKVTLDSTFAQINTVTFSLKSRFGREANLNRKC